ncbi:hypothetical protein BDN72DRAFT_883406 [Pluteus cervinus]|uniref:Uncharacterized protein n=1 Tax=Pluteus cervinus TaxID=181527 RepID=A0ACD3A5D8_9AGAR|nr:hypothetical protein BDN72DRAFT_883406 [Pluteus cervinus]
MPGYGFPGAPLRRPEGDNSALWASIVSECHRIRFILGVVGSSVANFNQPMPLLEHVIIPSECVLSPSVISPSLRTLVLSKCDFTWNYWPTLPHLTTLEVEDPVQRVSFDSFLVILFGCPRLEHLTIKNIFPASTSSQPHDLKPAEPSLLLPRLSSLHANESPFSSELLCRLRFTDNFSIIDLDAGPITADSVPLIMQALNHILLESSKTILSVQLTKGHWSRNPCSLDLAGPEPKYPFIRLKLDIWHQGKKNFSSCAQYLSVLPLDKMEDLETDIFDNPALWKESGLSQLSNLRRVDVSGEGVAFLEHLAKDYQEFRNSNGEWSLSFTSLRDVEMTGTIFTAEVKNMTFATLAGRNSAGYRLKSIKVMGIDPRAIVSDKELEEYVDDVDVSFRTVQQLMYDLEW